LLPNEELDGDTGAALAVWVSVGIAISEIKASAAMNFLMTHLLLAERCPVSFNNDTANRHAFQSRHKLLKAAG
jgi:hypothetical protein